MGIMNLWNTIFATLIAVGIVYNAARISLSERARELASLRVIGFGRGEVSYILLGELAILTLLALPVGCGLGALLQIYMASQFDSELFQIPLVFTARTFGMSVLVVCLAAVGSALLVRRQIDGFDLVQVLKARE